MALRVSCIVPVFNGERFLAEAIESIVGQTYPIAEVIVVDDGSTDGSAAIARDWGGVVRCLSQPNAGPSSARNLGIISSTGDCVAFLDADDRWHPDKTARQVQRLEQCPRVEAVVGHAEMFHDEDSAVAVGARPAGVPIPAYSSVTLLARRRAFERVGLFDTGLKHADDTDWFLRARALGVGVDLLPDVVLYRRLHAGNISSRQRTDSFDEYLRLIKRNIDRRRGA